MAQAPLYLLSNARIGQDDIPDTEDGSDESSLDDDVIDTSGGPGKYGYIPEEI